MGKFISITGTIVEAQRFVNAWTKWGRRPAHPERRELWLRILTGQERKFIIHSRWLAARKGHRVVLLMHANDVVGLYNLSNQEVVNYTRTDPVGLWHGMDLLLSIGIGIWAGVAGSGIFRGMEAIALVWCLLLLKRAVMRSHFQYRVDRALGTIRANTQGAQP